MMNCTVTSAIVFVICILLYGTSYAFVAKGLVYFTAGVFQTFRMFFGFVFTVALLCVRLVINKSGYRQIVRSHFRSGWKPIVFLLIDGLINLGVPHCLIAVAQQWVSSSNVQLMQPVATCAGAIFAHFVLPDEPFTRVKLYSLICAVIGVVLCGIPAFQTSESTGASLQQMAIGYSLIIVSVCMFGIAPVFYKWKIPNAEVTTGVTVQLVSATLWNVVWALCFDGPKKVVSEITSAPPIGWLWPVMVGVLVSGVGVHCLMWIVGALGSFGSNLCPFGNFIVGVVTGVAFDGDWNAYSWWQILMCCIGICFIISSLAIGFFGKVAKKKEEKAKEEEEEDVEDLEEMNNEERRAQEGEDLPEL